MQAAYALNRPLRLFQSVAAANGDGPSQSDALVAAEPAQVVIEAVKRAADGDGLIVRMYEAHGGRCQASVRASVLLADVAECDLLERPLTAEASPAYQEWLASASASHDAPVWDQHGWTCHLRPYEVRTFRVRLAAR